MHKYNVVSPRSWRGHEPRWDDRGEFDHRWRKLEILIQNVESTLSMANHIGDYNGDHQQYTITKDQCTAGRISQWLIWLTRKVRGKPQGSAYTWNTPFFDLQFVNIRTKKGKNHYPKKRVFSGPTSHMGKLGIVFFLSMDNDKKLSIVHVTIIIKDRGGEGIGVGRNCNIMISSKSHSSHQAYNQGSK